VPIALLSTLSLHTLLRLSLSPCIGPSSSGRNKADPPSFRTSRTPAASSYRAFTLPEWRIRLPLRPFRQRHSAPNSHRVRHLRLLRSVQPVLPPSRFNVGARQRLVLLDRVQEHQGTDKLFESSTNPPKGSGWMRMLLLRGYVVSLSRWSLVCGSERHHYPRSMTGGGGIP
jgi:hypothetical protein